MYLLLATKFFRIFKSVSNQQETKVSIRDVVLCEPLSKEKPGTLHGKHHPRDFPKEPDAKEIRSWAFVSNPNRVATTIRTPMRLPQSICGIPSAVEPFSTIGTLKTQKTKENGDKIISRQDGAQPESLTLSVPRPSQWIFNASIHQQTCNNPVEDRGLLDLLKSKSSTYTLAAVIDGHSGWQVSEYVSQVLSDRLSKVLDSLETSSKPEVLLQDVFKNLDAEIFASIEKAIEMGFSKIGRPGATTNCVLIGPTKIYSLNLGDSVSFLCRNGVAVPLCEPHNAAEKKEQDKLRNLHPNEADVYKKIREKKTKRDNLIIAATKTDDASAGSLVHLPSTTEGDSSSPVSSGMFSRLSDSYSIMMKYIMTFVNSPCFEKEDYDEAYYTKGRLQLTRAFGDYYLKTPKCQFDFQDGKVMVNSPVSYPYLSAVPDVQIIMRDKSKDNFIFIASDGVWDFMKMQEVADLVSSQLRKNKTTAQAVEVVKNEVLRRAAKEGNMTVDEMLELSPKARRKLYDDLTCVLVDLRQ